MHRMMIIISPTSQSLAQLPYSYLVRIVIDHIKLMDDALG